MPPVRKTLQLYNARRDRLMVRLNELKEKRTKMKPRLSVTTSNTVRPTQEGIDGGESSSMEMASQSALATDVLVEILELKLGFINETISSLQALTKENQRQPTPVHLQVSRFDDWVDTNQQLYELNVRLYDIQKDMCDMKRSQQVVPAPASTQDSLFSLTANAGSMLRNFKSATSTIMNLYVSERLNPRSNRTTIEATKLEEYVQECVQFQRGSLDHPPIDPQGHFRGAHPRSYHAFVEVLCNYITERHKSSQGEELQTAEVYTAIEHQLIPRIKPFIMNYIKDPTKDKLLDAKCREFEGVTLSQLRVPNKFQPKELIPFADSIACLKGLVFSESPTDKMYTVVTSAKLVHDKLGKMELGAIDGDTFLDLWIYVTIKANVRDLATNVKLMSEYGNPQLSMGEAGYYLTTIAAAMDYIEKLTPDKLGEQPENDHTFLVCEQGKAKQLCNTEGFGFEMVKENVEVSGYRVAVVRKWVLDTSRLFRTVLVNTGSDEDKALVSVMRLSHDKASPQSVQFFYNKLTEPQMPWIMCTTSIMNSISWVTTPQNAIQEHLIYLPCGPAEESLDTLSYVIQLARVSSEHAHVFESDVRNRTRSLHHSLMQTTSHSISHSPDDLTLSYDPFDQPSQHRTRFSLPVKKFISRTNKSSRRTLHTERILGGVVNQLYEHRPLPQSPPESIEYPNHGIIVTAEIHNNIGPSPSSPTSKETNNDDTERDHSKHGEHSLSFTESTDRGFPDYFSDDYLNTLETNFVSNHLNGEKRDDLKASLVETVQQCQLVLQRLNYLSALHKLDGIYDDITMNAVQLYQITHNQDSVSLFSLALDGILSVTTFHCMMDELSSKFKNMIRLCKDLGIAQIDDDTDLCSYPLSTKQEDLKRFAELVSSFQQKAGIAHSCKKGVLCAVTAACIKKMMARSRRTL